MWICDRCGEKRDELGTFTNFHPYGDTYASEVMAEFECSCGGEYGEEHRCNICDESFHETKLREGICQECLSELLTPVNCVKYIFDRKMWDEFLHEKKSCFTFVTDDLDDFLEWCEEKGEIVWKR